MSELNKIIHEFDESEDYEESYNKIANFIVEDLELYLDIVKKSQNLERLCVNLNALGSICKDASHTIETDLLGDIDD